MCSLLRKRRRGGVEEHRNDFHHYILGLCKSSLLTLPYLLMLSPPPPPHCLLFPCVYCVYCVDGIVSPLCATGVRTPPIKARHVCAYPQPLVNAPFLLSFHSARLYSLRRGSVRVGWTRARAGWAILAKVVSHLVAGEAGG